MKKLNEKNTILAKNKQIPNTVGHRGEIDRTPQEHTVNTSENASENLNKYYSGKNKYKQKTRFNIATLNARSLKSQESLLELENALETIHWDILGLSEVRRAEERTEEHDKYILYYKNVVAGLYGVGFMVKKYLKNEIIEFRGISDRIAVLNIKLPGHKQPSSIVQIYAPTDVTRQEVKNDFYNKLNEIMPTLYKTIIGLGDFNGQIGKGRTNEDKVLGPHTTGKRNDNGQRLINFAFENNLKIMNSYYKRNPNRKYTWVSPNGKIRNEIDYITTNRPRLFLNINIINQLNYNTDHRLLRGQLYTLEPKTPRKSIYNTKPVALPIPENILEALHSNLKKIENLKEVQVKYDALEKELKETESKMRTTREEKDKLGPKARKLIMQRKTLIRDRRNNKKEITNLSKEINLQIRKHREKLRTETLNYHIEKSGGVKKAWVELRDNLTWIDSMKNHRNKKSKTNRIEILEVATEYYRELYNNDVTIEESNQPVNCVKTDDEETPCILRDEINKAIKSQKKGKTPGGDCISNEVLIGSSKVTLNTITEIFNEILRTEYIPQQWTISTIILLHKKGNKDDIANYRPISLMSNVYKIFSKVLLDRLTKTLDENQPKEQAGFRSEFSTIDHIHSIKQVIQKCKEYNITFYLAFVDYNKAFDSLKHTKIWEALETQGVEKKYIRLITNIYKNMKAKIRTERDGDFIPIKRGVRQGDPLSPKLFSAVLEHVFRRLEWDNYGLIINGVRLNHLRFADDLIIISEDSKGLQKMLEQLVYESDNVGLSMNTAKTKIMSNSENAPIIVNGKTIEYVMEYTYLGQIISPIDLATKEINNRITLAWKRYWSLKEIMKNPLVPLKAKSKIFNTCILPVMTYGCQTWSLTNHNIHKLETCQHSMERSMLSIKLKDKIKLNTIRKKTKITDVTYCVKKLKWRWAGHMIRSNKDKWCKDVTEWCPRQYKRRKGRQRRRWEDDFKTIAGHTWTRQAQNRIRWRALGEAYAGQQDNLHVPVSNN